MQFGLAACEATIHVSDQPVTPSTGLTASSGIPAASIAGSRSGRVVPSALSPLLKDST